MIGVVADPEPRPRHPPQDVLVAGNPVANDEESGRKMVAFEVRDELRGLTRGRPVIKGQSDLSRPAIATLTAILTVTAILAVTLTVTLTLTVTEMVMMNGLC
jgi:hypothetical protein